MCWYDFSFSLESVLHTDLKYELLFIDFEYNLLELFELKRTWEFTVYTKA